VPIGGSLGVRPARQLEKNLLHKTYWGPPSSEMHSFWCSWVPSLLCCNNRLSFSCVWKPFFFFFFSCMSQRVYISLSSCNLTMLVYPPPLVPLYFFFLFYFTFYLTSMTRVIFLFSFFFSLLLFAYSLFLFWFENNK